MPSKTPSSTPAPTLSRLGQVTPPPFVGRARELEELRAAIIESPIVVLHGAVGAGKTRVALELLEATEGVEGLEVTRISCSPGDLGVAIVARAERAMDSMPGSLARVLHREARLLIIDDVHHLPPVDVARLVSDVAARPGAGRLLLLSRDHLPLPRRDARRTELTLEGLDEGAARQFWAHLEENYGATAEGACDKALGRTRGMPLALRREYARARYGALCWEYDEFDDEVRRALEAVSVARLPCAPAAVSALLEESDVEAALIELVSRQLIDPLSSGRFAIHDVIRDQVLELMDQQLRVQMELRAVELIRGMGRGRSAQRPAWLHGDDGAIELIDDVDRSCEVMMHLMAADKSDEACEELARMAQGALARGAGGELSALVERLREAGVVSPELGRVSATIAHRQGRIADAMEQGSALDPSTQAYLQYRIGELPQARLKLGKLLESESLDERASAASALSEILLATGEPARAEELLIELFDAHRAELSASSRAKLHLALSKVEMHRGELSSARAAISRASSAADNEELAARVEVAKTQVLVEEARLRDAREAYAKAEAKVAEIDCVPLRDELARAEAILEAYSGSLETAEELLRSVISASRDRGDEIGAFAAEAELGLVLWRAGKLSQAAEVAYALKNCSARQGLKTLMARAQIIEAAICLSELRVTEAVELIAGVERQQLSCEGHRLAAQICREAQAWAGHQRSDADKEVHLGALESARLAMAEGQAAAGLSFARQAAVEAERLGLAAILCEALALVARLELARGDREAARAAASRAARESLGAGSSTARVAAFAVLASLARDDGELREAAIYARDAVELATKVGLTMERFVATQALEVISLDGQDSPSRGRGASAATLSKAGMRAADGILSDLGFSTARPYRCVAHDGRCSYVASASPELLGMNERSLVVDAVRQVIVRDGKETADLRRRSLLKRLLFLFASDPQRVFSKEEIVEAVWEVEYHPLRHDAALFTNIMRIRRLLGEDGADLIAVSEEGYSLLPPTDFLYVEENVN